MLHLSNSKEKYDPTCRRYSILERKTKMASSQLSLVENKKEELEERIPCIFH